MQYFVLSATREVYVEPPGYTICEIPFIIVSKSAIHISFQQRASRSSRNCFSLCDWVSAAAF